MSTNFPTPEDYFNAHGTVEHFDGTTKPNGKLEHHFELVRFKDVEVNRSRGCLVKGLIPREGLVVCWGPPKCGKTFFVYDLMMHVALGWEYHGRRVQQAPVVYIACEGERGLKARTEAFRREKLQGDEDPAFFLLTTRLNLPQQVDLLVRDIADQIPPDPVGAVVLDTLNRSIGGSESDDKDMSAYVEAAATVAHRFRCVVIIIHHCGVNDKRPRGHTSLTGAVDAQLATVRRNEKTEVAVTVEYMRDGPEGAQIVNTIKVVDCGPDEDGDPITSLVLIPVRDTQHSSPRQPDRKLTTNQKLALDVIKEALARHGKEAPASLDLPPLKTAVGFDIIRRIYLSRTSKEDGDASTRRKALRRSRDELNVLGIIGFKDEMAWLP